MHTKIVNKEFKEDTQFSKQTNLAINACYMEVLSVELMLRDVERRLATMGARIQREKKQKYNFFLDHCKKALHFAELLTEDIFEVDAEHGYKNISTWQDESNELSRLILLYADRSADADNIEKVFKHLRDLPGEGIVDEEMLKYYYLHK